MHDSFDRNNEEKWKKLPDFGDIIERYQQSVRARTFTPIELYSKQT